MKRTYIFFIAAASFIVAVNFSCKKSSESNSTTTVEYKISPLDSNILGLEYNDNTNKTVSIQNPSAFVSSGDHPPFLNGSETILVSTKPFLAKIEITVLNSTSTSLNYDLEILVDGQEKKSVSVNVPVNSNNVIIGSADFTVP